MKKDLEENFSEDSRVQTLLSALLLDKNTSWKESRREVTNWASQSNSSLEERRFHDGPWSKLDRISTTFASFWVEMRNNLGNKDARGESSYRISFQNLMERPSPSANLVWGRNRGYNLQMFFHSTDQLEEWRWEQSHPLECSLYLWDIVDFHNEFLSIGNRQSHLPSKTMFLSLILPIPKPPSGLEWHASFQLTKWSFFSIPLSHRKSLWSFSTWRHIFTGILNKDM